MEQRNNVDYWNKRAVETESEELVTHRDLFQKKLELELISPHLDSTMRVLEVGCGNGYVTEFLSDKVAQVDGFDISEEMVKKAKARLSSKKNCRLFVSGLPDPCLTDLEPHYDAVLSVRVLINLPSIDSQSKAIDWIASKLKSGGKFLLLEGSSDGLNALNELRVRAGLSAIKQAPFNINIDKSWLEDATSQHFEISQQSSIGIYDYLTRFFYPLLVGEENVEYNTDLHQAAFRAAQVTPNDGNMFNLSRLHIYSFVKK